VSLKKACHDAGTDEGGNRVTAVQQSAEGIVGGGNEPDDPGREARARKTGGLTLLKARTVPFQQEG
jgi:hypothetical protein